MSTNAEVVALLKTAYRMELETTMNYIANGINLDGVRAEEIKKVLILDVTEELGHAQQLAKRIKQLDDVVPGSLEMKFQQTCMQTPEKTTDLVGVIKGVIEAEEAAIAHYKVLIETAGAAKDYVTEDMCVQLLASEEEHRVQFRGYLKEYTTD